MSWKYLKQVATYSCYTLSGFSLYYLINNEKFKIVQNSWTSDYQSSVKWDFNWDHRDSTSLVKPLSEGASPEKQNEYNEIIEKHRSKAIRHIILIRHGQYNLNGFSDKERILTELGRKQAKITGDRLKELNFPITEFVMSTMTRAQETGKIILHQLETTPLLDVKNDSLIEEGAPIPPEPKVGHWRPRKYFFVDGARIEAGFRKHFYRAEPSQKEDSYTVLVCHANVIRYYVCRALQIPSEAWLRISLYHASITWLSIHPNGRVILRILGDSGHIPLMYLSK